MIVLHDFFRSSACYRVRIALNLKGLPYERRVVDFRAKEQTSDAFRVINPQGLVPVLEIDGRTLTQSLAIIDYIDQTRQGSPLIPSDPAERAEVLALALMIACDVHPIDNLRVLTRLKQQFGADDAQVTEWYVHWVEEGLTALERRLATQPTGSISADGPGLFEICLVPQLYNARRYNVDLTPYPILTRIDAAACALPAFSSAAPERFAPAA